MQGISNSEKQIRGVGNPTGLSDAVNAKTIQNGSLVFSSSTGIDTFNVTLALPPLGYLPGMIVNFKASNTIKGPAFISVNGLGVIPVKKAANLNLDSADIINGQMVTLIFDGSNFQVLSQLNKNCPFGFVDVNGSYCIEVDERSANSWWQANVICGNINSRLCTMTEWYHACQKSGLGLNNMINNFEWIDSAANHNDRYAKIVGIDLGGLPSCEAGTIDLPENVNSFRCCFSK